MPSCKSIGAVVSWMAGSRARACGDPMWRALARRQAGRASVKARPRFLGVGRRRGRRRIRGRDIPDRLDSPTRRTYSPRERPTVNVAFERNGERAVL
jgi:hypothetical protein